MIEKAIEAAYNNFHSKNYEKIYWAIDLHGVCLKSNYKGNSFELINDKVIPALKLIQEQEESVIIFWSSCYEEEKQKILEFFDLHDIHVGLFNENIFENNSETGCFDEKFYYSILLDDKAGFDPNVDWDIIIDILNDDK